MNTERTTNRYLLWLEHGAHPPVRGSLSKATEAAEGIRSRYHRAVRALLKNGTSWAAFDNLLAARRDMGSLIALVSCQVLVSKRMNEEGHTQWNDHWEDWTQAQEHKIGRGHLYKTLMALHQQAPSANRKEQVHLLLMAAEGDPNRDHVLRQLNRKQEKRERLHAKAQNENGGIHVAERMTSVHPDYLRAARVQAKKKGLSGYLFQPGTEESDTVLSMATNVDVRKKVWAEQAQAPLTANDIDQMRRRRHEVALSFGEANYAALHLREDAIFPNPKKIVLLLKQAQLSMKKEVSQFMKALTAFSAEKSGSEGDGAQPWNATHWISKAFPVPYCDYTKIFPWRETVLRIFPEMFEACGWSQVRPVKISGKGIWTVFDFLIEREDGQQGHLIYSPFRPRQEGHSYSAGEAAAVHNTWRPEGLAKGCGVVWINQTLDTVTPCFTPYDLQILCHEIGHAFHFLAVPGHGPDEAAYIPSDLSEVPSYLLQLYARDPVVLARLASPNGPASARRARFWFKRLAHSECAAIDHMRDLRVGMLDMQSHIDPTRGFESLSRAAFALGGQKQHAADQTWLREFIWDENMACWDYTQTCPVSLAQRLVTVGDNGCVNAKLIAQVYSSLTTEVLIPGTTVARAARAWKQWTGESYGMSMRKATVAHAKQSARITRKATQLLRQKINKG